MAVVLSRPLVPKDSLPYCGNREHHRDSIIMKVLITTSGVGSRLGEYTQYTNKSLVQVGNKPALSWILESYPADAEFVITLGYFGDLVRQFVEIAHLDKTIQFVEVDDFEGPLSSLGYSMLKARDLLQSPFIYNAGDTLWKGTLLQEPTENWLGGFADGDSALYASFDAFGDRVLKINPKAGHTFDYLYVGLAGIYDHEEFWDALAGLHDLAPEFSELNDLSAIETLLSRGHEFKVNPVEAWYDIGNLTGLETAREVFLQNLPTLEKRDEAIFYIDNKVVKFFSDGHVSAGRVKRAGILSPHVPRILASTENWYSYGFVEGDSLSDVVNPTMFGHLLSWAQKSFWTQVPDSVDDLLFQATCEAFYFDKSVERINLFLNRSGLEDAPAMINGFPVPPALELIQTLRDSNLLVGKPGLIHGDFILDNILRTSDSFIGVDWRQGFGDLLAYGDVYYDLAKLNHSLTMDHSVLLGGDFSVDRNGSSIRVDIFRKSNLLMCEEVLEDFASDNGYDLEQIRVLTPLIWLNMAALHSHPMSLFLFEYGKLSLFRALGASGS
jgi:choline kinase